MTRVLVGDGRVVVHPSPSTSMVIVCGPFTPYVSLVSKLSSSCIIDNRVRTCQRQIIKSMKYQSNKSTQIAHSLTQSGVQGVPPMPLHPQGKKTYTFNKTESIEPVYIK
jgi:hypothetical protein